MQKVLIFGARGSLGGYLSEVFSANDFQIFALSRDDADITNEESVRQKILEIRPDIIFNAAAYNAVDLCEQDAEFQIALAVNGFAPGYIASAAREIGTVFVHFSTDYVFDGQNQNGYAENDCPCPLNRYGQTKLFGENEILRLADGSFKYYIIRVSKLFGKKGESETVKNSFFDVMLKLATEKDEVKVVDAEIGCFTYTKDLAEATKILIFGQYDAGIYHVVNQGACSWYEAAKFLFEIKGITMKITPIKSEDYPRLAPRPAYSQLLNTKFIQLRSYREALMDYYRVKI